MKTKTYVMTTLNGMVYGLFATLIIGVIIQQFGVLIQVNFISDTIAKTLMALMGVGIGMGIALSLEMKGLKMVVASLMGGIATSFKVVFGTGIVVGLNNDPATTYLVVVLGILLLDRILFRKTPIDILLIPLIGALLATVLTLGLSGPIGWTLGVISEGIQRATAIAPFPMSIVIAVVMGMLLTAPVSSAAIAIAINLNGIAGGAAVVGTTVQMIGFAVQSRRDNRIGMVLSIGFGTSMLQFKNIIKKPVIWLPTIIASAILSPLVVLTLKTETSKIGSGMGSSGLVGQLQTLSEMNYSTNSWLSIGFIFLGSILLVYLIDLIFYKAGWIQKGDLRVEEDIK